MDVFSLRDRVVSEYSSYVKSFLNIRDCSVRDLVEENLSEGVLWPNPLVQLNPTYEVGSSFEELVEQEILHPGCVSVFCKNGQGEGNEPPLRLHRHQTEAIRSASSGSNFVLTTGTGSGKSLAYMVPIVDHVLRKGSGNGIKAILVYPMNALANSQREELRKFMPDGDPHSNPPVTFERYTGQESPEERKRIKANPPDILLTNYMMLELILTRPDDKALISSAQGLKFLVLDELHTYRGRQGADIAMLVRRVRQACGGGPLIHVGTSATLGTGDSWKEQQQEIAAVAEKLYGVEFQAENVIGETLRRVTDEEAIDRPAFTAKLRARLQEAQYESPPSLTELRSDPLAIWIESTLGLQTDSEGRLARRKPQSISGANGVAVQLSERTGVDIETCEAQLQSALLSAHLTHDEDGRPVFAFRLNQFVSKGDVVYASVESPGERFTTLRGQKYVPGGDRSRLLFPLAFCRRCGQDYYTVWRQTESSKEVRYVSRPVSDMHKDSDRVPGFLYISDDASWLEDMVKVAAEMPTEAIDPKKGYPHIKATWQKFVPKKVRISGKGVEGAGDQEAYWMTAPFRWCPQCKAYYGHQQRSDFPKLATLGTEGRSSATTVMTLAAIQNLRELGDSDAKNAKLLSFTDNRQDASLQAGHFNDHVKVVSLRSALWRALRDAGDDGVQHHELATRVYDALDLSIQYFARRPDAGTSYRHNAERAFRAVLGYYVYQDLRRGWRITAPNLEQCGLLDIDYMDLTACCEDDARWSECKLPLLSDMNPQKREKLCKIVLDHFRQSLAINVDYLSPNKQEEIKRISTDALIDPWKIDEGEVLEECRVMIPRDVGISPGPRHHEYLTPAGKIGRELVAKCKESEGAEFFELDKHDETNLIVDLCVVLEQLGILEATANCNQMGDVGYRLEASAMVWKARENERQGQGNDCVADKGKAKSIGNKYFRSLYTSDQTKLFGIEGREHTAQVDKTSREKREKDFREGTLPILYCSPTMELGIDIAELNVVNLRNVPPTPANYAQRSGRAGRGGQPAFVFTYCAAGSSHDQYFFRRPQDMVGGHVVPPRIDINNEDLVRAHIHSVWLSVAGIDFGRSLVDVIDVDGESPSYRIRPHVVDVLADRAVRERAFKEVMGAMGDDIRHHLAVSEQGAETWVWQVLDQIPAKFEFACQRWIGLYRSALEQSQKHYRASVDAQYDRHQSDIADRMRRDARNQLKVLKNEGGRFNSDFYSYRYLATEGFLPGYNFPRLPISVYLPLKWRSENPGDFLSRARFLAITEFGPESIIYHEGSTFRINRAILPAGSDDGLRNRQRATHCNRCGYMHLDEIIPDFCENCKEKLPPAHRNMFEMPNQLAVRRERITSDEEDRVRHGYRVKCGYRFAVRDDKLSCQRCEVSCDQVKVGEFMYGHGATLRRLNLGWSQADEHGADGFDLDADSGSWVSRRSKSASRKGEQPRRVETVIPYVQDVRNCLIFRPATELTVGQMATLESAIKVGLMAKFQLDDSEIATEALPGPGDRKYILFYESSEGGAGVLRHVVEDRSVISDVARFALETCHIDPETGEDVFNEDSVVDQCDAGCYECLLSYYNQRDHDLLDRKLLHELLAPMVNGIVSESPTVEPRQVHFERILNDCESGLERRWLEKVNQMGLQLPSHAQKYIQKCSVRPDFVYQKQSAAIFIDGPHHDQEEQVKVDLQQRECLAEAGWDVLVFRFDDDWEETLRGRTDIFGTGEVDPGKHH